MDLCTLFAVFEVGSKDDALSIKNSKCQTYKSCSKGKSMRCLKMVVDDVKLLFQLLMMSNCLSPANCSNFDLLAIVNPCKLSSATLVLKYADM